MISCPSTDYIHSILSTDSLINGKGVNLKYVFHHVGSGVLQDPHYIKWLNSFAPDVEVGPNNHEAAYVLCTDLTFTLACCGLA